MTKALVGRESRIIYPPSLSSLYTQPCIGFRGWFNEEMTDFLERRSKGAECDSVTGVFNRDNLLIPHDCVLEKLEYPFDIITASVLYDGNASLMVQCDSTENSSGEGVGKTGIMYELLGIKIHYDSIPDDAQGISQDELVMISADREISMRIVSSDMPYVGFNGGQLFVAPPNGEQLIAQWDMARHVCRIKDNGCTKDKGKVIKSAQFIERLAGQYYLDPELFAGNEDIYPVRNIFLISRVSGSEVGIKQKTKRHELLQQVLGYNPVYHESRFWEIDVDEHDRRVCEIMERIDEDKLPNIYEVHIPDGSGVGISIQKAAQMISRKITGY